MKLLMGLSSIIAFTSCTVAMFLIRRKKFTFKFSIYSKTLKTKEDNLLDYDSEHDYCEIHKLPNTWAESEGIQFKEEEEYKSQNYNSKQNSCKILELPNPNWVKIGHVEKLYMYPLNTGVKKSCSTLKFTQQGIILKKKEFTLWDRMFRIYDEQIKQFHEHEQIQENIQMSVYVVDKSKVRFCATGMPDLTIDLDKETDKTLAEIQTSWITARYIDCGDIAAEWINICLRSSTLRLIRAEYDVTDETKIDKDLLRRETEAWELLMRLTRYVVITSESLKKIQVENHTQLVKVQPNIIISSSLPAFEEKKWEWIKINNIIIRTIMPVSSWISTIQNYRQKSFPIYQNDDCDELQFLGIVCGLYETGDINVNDNVYIHMEDSKNDSKNYSLNDSNTENESITV